MKHLKTNQNMRNSSTDKAESINNLIIGIDNFNYLLVAIKQILNVTNGTIKASPCVNTSATELKTLI